ncbi:hypothetical protein F2Q70_00017909 [Brassica cretica]|uniref:Uncharacterized protein n=1 Tax=Brassica cretica TaxID=69181 RepID=A0A8S9HSI3_BRACR|nr:hypothetical protein F2Q70_00017909 [Brassica cretica]
MAFVGITVLFLDEKVNSVIHGFTPVGRANHYMPSLKAGSIVKFDRFEIRLFDNLQVIANTKLELLDVVGQIRSVQGSGLTKETTRVVIRLLIDPFNQLLENVSLCLSNSSNRRLGVRNSTFESLRLGRRSQSIASGFLASGIPYSVIHGFTPVGRANHYMSSLKVGSIVKVDHFEVSRCSCMYKITDHPFLIRFISVTIIDEVITGAPEINLQSRLDYVVGQIRSVKGSGLIKKITRVVICLLIDPFNQLLENVSLCLSNSSSRRLGVRHSTFESLRLGRSSQSIASGFLASGIL